MKRTWNVVTVAITFLCMCLALLQFAHAQESGRQENHPKVLMFAAINISHLADSIPYWSEKVGVNGFFIDDIANWWTSRDKLFEKLPILTEVNTNGARYGVDSNFLKVALGYGNLPDWLDDANWANVVKNFGNISELAKRSGTRGIAVDTESYTIPLFDPRVERYKGIGKELLRAKVYQRGRDMMKAITDAFPDIEIIILPGGAFYWFNPDQGVNTDSWELWIDFWNGMASVNNKNGIVLAAERTYSVVDPISINKIYALEQKTMQEHVQDKAFWRDKCSIALGMWPLGKSYEDKAARYTAAQFRQQFRAAVALSPRYVWIYGHGAAWWQLNPEEVKKHSGISGEMWGPKFQMLPTTPIIDQFIAVIREAR
jgi:hypothetical protein